MSFLITIGGLASLVWGMLFVHRINLLMGATFVIVVSYIFGHAFLSFDAGPLPLTLDRLLFVGLVVACIWQWRLGRFRAITLSTTDITVLMVTAALTVNAAVVHPDALVADITSPLWRLLASYWLPCGLYFVVRHARVDATVVKACMGVLSALGVYLVATAIAEGTSQWWAVFPRYIADPSLGTHFGRARGPTLMAASMGVFLTFGLIALWYVFRRSELRIRAVCLAMVPFFMLATYLTYTRSTWLGLAGACGVIVLLGTKGWIRQWLVAGAVCVGLVVLATKWDSLLGLERETSASETRHSVSQRASFVYVSWKMFADHPWMGCGLGRFYDQKLAYLADRSQDVELESIRGLQHHNTFLSVLTETGIVGMLPFVAMLAAFGLSGWQLYRTAEAPLWARDVGVVTIAVVVDYIASAVFHDMSLSPTSHSMIYFAAALAVTLKTRYAAAAQSAWSWSIPTRNEFMPSATC